MDYKHNRQEKQSRVVGELHLLLSGTFTATQAMSFCCALR